MAQQGGSVFPPGRKARAIKERHIRAEMNRALLVFSIILLSGFSLFTGQVSANDYSRLIDFILLADQRRPLRAFSDFDDTLDDDSRDYLSDYFNDNPSLLKKIRKDLGGSKLRWRIARFESRYAFVPEQREEYAALFESYCRDVIRYILDQTSLPDPYREIQTLKNPRPEIPEQGITAFIVHNLVEQFLADCTFSGQKNKRIKIRLKGTVFQIRVEPLRHIPTLWYSLIPHFMPIKMV